MILFFSLSLSILQTPKQICKLEQDAMAVSRHAHTHRHRHTQTHTHTHIHLAPSRCFVHRCLPRNPQVSVFSRRRVGEQNHWRRPLHPNIKQNTRGKKKCTENLSKREGREKSKGFSNPSFIEVAGFRQRNLFYVWEAWPVIWVATTTRGTCNKTRLYSGMLCNNGRHHPLLLLEMEGRVDGWRWMDGQMDGSINMWTEWGTDGRRGGRKLDSAEEWVKSIIGCWTNKKDWLDGWMDRWLVGQTNSWLIQSQTSSPNLLQSIPGKTSEWPSCPSAL